MIAMYIRLAVAGADIDLGTFTNVLLKYASSLGPDSIVYVVETSKGYLVASSIGTGNEIVLFILCTVVHALC